MTNIKDSIDWIGSNEASMRNYEEERRDIQKHARSIFEIMMDNKVEEEKKIAAREAIIDMAKGLGKVVEEGKNDGGRN